MSARDINAVVSAELPSNPSDRLLVQKFMMHSHPNGTIPPYCNKKNNQNICRFKYPFEINQNTYINNEG